MEAQNETFGGRVTNLCKKKPRFPDNPLLTNDTLDKLVTDHIKCADITNFNFIETSPCDFYLQLDSTEAGKVMDALRNSDHSGIIFNLNTHDQAGSHWVSLFADNTTKEVEYYDSFGRPPNEYTDSFIDLFFDSYVTLYNTKVHQKKYSVACGIYAVWFLIARMHGVSMGDIAATGDLFDVRKMKQLLFSRAAKYTRKQDRFKEDDEDDEE